MFARELPNSLQSQGDRVTVKTLRNRTTVTNMEQRSKGNNSSQLSKNNTDDELFRGKLIETRLSVNSEKALADSKYERKFGSEIQRKND